MAKTEDLRCPYSGRCGGCSWTGMPYGEQLKKKEAYIRSLLKDICPVRPVTGMEDPYFYRNKVHAVFSAGKDGKIISGIYEKGTHHVIPVKKCLIEDQRADAVIRTVRRLAQSFHIKIYDEDRQTGFLRHVLIRTAHVTGEMLVVLVGASPVFPSGKNFVKALLCEHPEITSVVLNVNDRKTSMVLGKRDIVLWGRGWIEDLLCGLRFRISPQSFYQVNSIQTEKLYHKAAELAGLFNVSREKRQLRILDAYCGIGTIGIYAACACPQALVTGVELNGDAVRDAAANARMNRLENIRFAAGDATEWMKSMASRKGACDILFMDPPRSGSTEDFIRAASQLGPDRIIYISCGPETLARDLRLFRQRGYRALEAWPFDLFPFTPHTECVVSLSGNEKAPQGRRRGPQHRQ